jgi:hypothetical protein
MRASSDYNIQTARLKGKRNAYVENLSRITFLYSFMRGTQFMSESIP